MVETSFPSVSEDVLSTAEEKALEALSFESTPQNLAEYYNPELNYAGATFAELEPNDPERITATDLLATSTLNVDIPVRAVRRILEETEVADALSERLMALPAYGLEKTTAEDFVSMTEFYDFTKSLLSRSSVASPNPWVTTSKLVARKRPDLFPVRDNVVCRYLEINKLKDARKDWFVFRTLINTSRVQQKLQELPEKIEEAAAEAPLQLDREPMRLFDAALWRFAVGAAE